jgi:hypothetical protein
MACPPCPSEPLLARHPPATLPRALQLRQPARLASTDRRRVQTAPVSGRITVAGAKIHGLLHARPVDAQPVGSCVHAHAVALTAHTRTGGTRAAPLWPTHVFPSHALQRRQPARLASVG